MIKSTVLVLAAVFAGIFCAAPASAQSISIVSGNGQLACQTCFTFAPMIVRVTDANGNPLSGVTVTWLITSGGFGAALNSASTTTAYDGTTSNTYYYNSFLLQGSPFLQYVQNTVTASITNASVAFSLTQALYDPGNPSFPAVTRTNLALVQALLVGQPLSGQAGTTGGSPLQVQVITSNGVAIPNVSLQLVSYLNQNPLVNCATGAGAATNTVLTDATGTATCYPIFGGLPGTGQFEILIGAGGVVPTDPTVPPFGNFVIGPLNLSVAAAQPGLIKIISGNTQSAAPGQPLGTALQVEVDTAAGGPVSGQSVNWTFTPAGSVGLSSTTTSTDVTGRTSVTATFTASALGTVQIKATCPGCPTSAQSVTFSESAVPIVTVTGLSIVSGNNQSALVSASFGLPLIVQVNASNGQPGAGVPVQFAVTGPATLSSTSVSTDSTGKAQVSIQAGTTAGAVTVTATASGFTQSFTLTVSPPGPTLLISSFYNGADFQPGSLSPCSIATIIAAGVAPGIQGVVTPGSLFGALPYVLASDTVSFGGASAPIFNVANVNGQQQITVQVPCEVIPSSSVPVTVNVGSGAATVNVLVSAASPGIFQTTMSDGVLRAVAIRPDGSWVSLANPARRGETVRAYATGLGVTSPTVGTNATAIPGVDAIVQGTLIMGVTNSAGQGEGVRVSTARVAPDLIGVFEIPFLVPTDAATGNNVSFSIGVIPVGGSAAIYSGTAKIPIQ